MAELVFWLQTADGILRAWPVTMPDTATAADIWREWYAQTRGVLGLGGWE